jgi:glycosyltransferase involved in cell wall biosynthesis
VLSIAEFAFNEFSGPILMLNAARNVGEKIERVVTETGTLGVVIIGRNEGDRLIRCLESVRNLATQAVYVDSGSTDESVSASKALGFDVVELDLHRPFTAARARNEGFHRLLELYPLLDFVFFVDGDCEVNPGWLALAGTFLVQHPGVAAVYGRRRERFPEKSVYNMLCDIEWDEHPAGESKACGGDVVMRVAPLRAAGGYRAELICGEEPELCVRLRQAGWRIWCLDAEMTLHDAAMHHFGQWWKRMLRGGYSFAIGAALHGAAPERHCVREYRSAWIWGLWIPLGICVLALVFGVWALLLFFLYPIQVIRLAHRGTRSARENWWRAGSLVVGKIPEMLGELKYKRDQIANRPVRIIEYK